MIRLNSQPCNQIGGSLGGCNPVNRVLCRQHKGNGVVRDLGGPSLGRYRHRDGFGPIGCHNPIFSCRSTRVHGGGTEVEK